MSNLMARQSHTSLLIFYCFTLFCICGKGQASLSCDTVLMVKRGIVYGAVPQKSLTVSCPVHHCGESLNISWCKLLDMGQCVQINYTDNVEIHQSDNHPKHHLISKMTFKRISIHDDGLYRCYITGQGDAWISHTINISVSDFHQGVEVYERLQVNNADQSPGDRDMSWLPYFLICAGMALLVTTMTVMTLTMFNCKKRIRITSHTSEQEMPTQVLPDLPRGSAPSSPCLQTPPRLPSHPPPVINRKLPAVANTAAESQKSDHATYAVIKHKMPETAVGQEQPADAQDKMAKYAVVNIS